MTGAPSSYVYTSAGTYTVRLRVTDDEGAMTTTERAVPVVDGVPPETSLRDGAVAAAARTTRFSTKVGGKLTSTGQRFINGRTLSGTGLTARGRMRLKGLPRPLSRKRRARWAAAFTTRQRGSKANARLAAAGYLLLDLRRGDRVCFNGRIAGRIDKPFSGRLAVVGGTGKGRHLRGSARVLVPGTKARVRGTLNLARAKKARQLPRPCRSLVRRLR